MSYPFDTVSAGIVAAINGRKDGTLTSTQAAELLEPLLETIAPSQLSQLNSVIQVLGRAKGLFFTNGVPANTLGAIGSSAIDLENHMFYGPKTSLGWPAGIQFVGDTGAPGESYADIARNLGNVFGVPVDEDSTDAEVLIAVAQAAANLVTPGFNSILVELHGAIANNPAIDNAAAINAAETAAALVGATVEFKAGATYYFKSQIGGNRNGLTWIGKNTSLVYNGASTTIDLVKFGNDSTEKTGMLVQGLSIRSLTTMTAGAAVRTPLVCRSRFEFINIQGQDYRETNGNKLYNGIYADRVDNVHFSGTDIVAQNNGFMLRGATGAGPKADCWVDFRKICYCTVGFLMGGAFGGAYIGVNDYIVNGTDVFANQSLQAEQNRELFINGGIFDGATNASSASIVLDDPGALLVQINGSWIASGLGHGVWIKQSTGKIILSSPRIWNFAKDGIRNDVGSSAVISISDAQIHDNGAWGVNPTVSGHHTTVADSRLFSNVSGNINTTYAPASRAMTNYADITNLTSTYVLSSGLYVDAAFGSYLSGGNPYTAYDTNDYSVYDRIANRYGIFVNGGQVFSASVAGVNIGPGNDALLTRGGAGIIDQRNGVNAQAHWISNTFTDASNYERGVVGWNGNNFDVNTAQAGTGVSRNLRLYTTGAGELQLGVNSNISWKIGSGGHWLANADSAYDIGASGANRPRNVYVASILNSPEVSLNGQVRMQSLGDGVWLVRNTAGTDFGRLMFGGTTNAFPALKRNGAGIDVRLADDTGYALLIAAGLSSTGGFVTFGPTSDVWLARDGADILAMRRSTGAQTFRVYNTYTDGSNYERGVVGWASNVMVFGIENAGTGGQRSVRLSGGTGGNNYVQLNPNASTRQIQTVVGGSIIHYLNASGHTLFETDNTYDLGGASNRVRTGYFGTSLVVAGVTVIPSVASSANTTVVRDANGTIAAGNVTVTSTAPGMAWIESDAAANARTWMARADGSVLNFSTMTDAFGAGSTFLSVGRSGTSVTGLTLTAPTLTLAGSVGIGASDTVLIRDAADILAMRRTTNAQFFRLYETYTDASNFSRLAVGYQNSAFEIVAQKLGTGLSRNIRLGSSGIGSTILATGGSDRWYVNSSGHFLANADNAYDIGASGATRPRTIYAGTSIIVPTPAVADSSTKVATTAFVTNLTTTGRNRVFVEDYGAVAGNSSIDNASAINAAEAAAAAIGAEVCFKSNVSYYFKSTIGGARNGLMWTGLNTSLIYNGASTTLADMVLFGDDTNIYYDMKVEGFIIRSLTNMTAGNAMRTPLICRSTFDVGIQGQDFYQANGNYIYNGIYADRIDNVRYNGLDCIAKNKGFTIRGATSTGPKAGCWMNISKIALCALAIHVGGAFGGIMIGATDLIQNGINLRVDQGLQAEENREIFCNGTIFDVTTNASEASIVLNDAGNTFVDIRNAWVASSAGHGVWIKQGTGKIMFSAVRIFNNAGDGFRSDVGAGTLVNIVGGQIHNNGGYGINPTNASGNYIRIGDTISFASNTSGAVNETYLNSAGPATLSQRYFGVANGSGVLTIAHGDSALPNKLLNVTAFYEHATGVSIPLTMNYIDGTNLVFNANASAASKNCRVLVTSQTAAKWS